MNQQYIIIALVSILVLFCIYKLATMKLAIQLKDRDSGIEFVGGKRGSIGIEYFNLNPAPLNYRISTGSNQLLKNCLSNLPLGKKNNFIIQGNQVPIHPNKSELKSDGPSVDGTSKTPNNMFMFAYNQCNPKCCPSTYSCDGGCICTTKDQSKFLSSRGSNNNGESEY
uniref:Uncharacterized protein n=1 Tax=viral metagenome TaxID=1070528 RepID=A0A6C0M0U4_9ZZZZ